MVRHTTKNDSSGNSWDYEDNNNHATWREMPPVFFDGGTTNRAREDMTLEKITI